MTRVLIVDDINLRDARNKLKPYPIRDRGEGTSGKIVLPMVRTAVPDVILMAVGLPDVDGIETSRDLMKAPAADRFNHQPLRRRDHRGGQASRQHGLSREASQGARA